MAHRIVNAAGRAKRAGVKPGDLLLSVNGESVVDFIDYQALTAEKKLTLSLLRDGKPLSVRIAKPEYEDPGLTFESPMLSGMRLCANKCLFCFVDQWPDTARASLRVKDDDWRMSLMMGNYVTLTNVPMAGIERIIKRHASPLYISVHAMDPCLRAHMMGTERARLLPEQLKRLSEGGVSFHCQAVLCPGINDGEKLEETILELVKFMPSSLSLALVPVGLTDSREGLAPLRKYNKEEARAVIGIAEKWREKLLREKGTRFVFPSDEFYLTAGLPLPEDEEYEGYGQIDDGVGMLRLLETEFADAYRDLPEEVKQPAARRKPVAIGCGTSAAEFFRSLLEKYPFHALDVQIHGIENRFFGPSVTVSALLTGGDLLREFEGDPAEEIFFTETMLRPEDKRFLDDMEYDELAERLGRPLVPVGRTGYDLADALARAAEECRRN